MPVEFLTKEQKQQYGCFTDIPNELQLTRHCVVFNVIFKER